MAKRVPPPPPAVRAIDQDGDALYAAFHDAAHLLEVIREDWKAGDVRMGELLKSCDPGSNGYYEIVRYEYRSDVSHALGKKLDREFLPFILPHCDPSLRDRVQTLRDKLELDTFQETDDEPKERWRLQWGRLRLDRELDGVAAALRARGDAIRLGGLGAVSASTVAKVEIPKPSLPPRPKPVAKAIEAIIAVEASARSVAASILEGRRWEWDKSEPKPWRPPPSRDEYVAAQRRRVETTGKQAWSDALEAGAIAEWEDSCDFHREHERLLEAYRQWRAAILQHWDDLKHSVTGADAAVRALRPHLDGVRSNPQDWVNETLHSLGMLRALWSPWGECPWVGEPEELTGPLGDLLNRLSFLQTAEFRTQNGLGGDEAGNRTMRKSAWFDKATKGGLYAELLGTARSEDRLRVCEKLKGRWLYEVHEVCRVWPEYATKVLAHLAGEAKS